MTKLERRSRMLMRAYPIAYRRERADEMLGTLLDTTPPGRNWPLPRDSRALLAGGMRARLAAQRQLSLGSKLRTSLYAGFIAYLGYIAVENLCGFIHDATTPGDWHMARSIGWPYLVAMALIAVTVVLAVADSRRVAVLAGAIPAAAAVTYYAFGAIKLPPFPGAPTLLACLAALVVLSGRGARLARWWLWPVGWVVVLPLLSMYAPGGPPLLVLLTVAVGAMSLAWIPVDARPAIAVCVFVLVYWLPIAVQQIVWQATPRYPGYVPELAPVAITVAIAALAAWRLRSQSAGAGRQRI